MENQPLQPIRAKERGRTGRKHIVCQRRLNEVGQVEIYLTCPHSQCGCGGWFSLEELFSVQVGVEEKEKEKEAA
jgi:hypothetical protein